MPDWTKSMEQSFEYYTVEPTTLADIKRLDTVKNASFGRDLEAETLGSATIDVANSTGEKYIRGYLKTIQNGVIEKFPLGTVLSQTPSSSFNGKILDVSMDCYTPLIELKEKFPPIGYTVRKGANIMDEAYRIMTSSDVDENGNEYKRCRVPVEKVDCETTLQYDVVANTDDTWLSFIIYLISNAGYELRLSDKGGIYFAPKQQLESLQPIWTFDDSNSSILYPDISVNHDLYGIPNQIEVIYSHGHSLMTSIVTNSDPNSVTSTVNRGRIIPYKDTDPSIRGYTTQEQLDAYAEKKLKELSVLEYTVSFTHAYCPVRIGDCVRLDYKKAGINGVKAKIISQNIKAEPGCPVSAKAVFTSRLWE